MALSDKKYERIFSKTGNDADKITDAELADIKGRFDNNDYIDDKANFSALGPLLYQMQNIVEELDVLRTEISSNKDKTTFPGFGTSRSTCLAGNTTTITTSQANAITTNTKKTGISDSQADAIVANTAKTGITSEQSKAITINTAKISFPTCTSNIEGATATITGFEHLYDAKSEIAPNKLKINLQVVNGKTTTNYSTSLTLTQEKG